MKQAETGCPMPHLRIIVVDDEQIVALDLRRTLEGLGYAVPTVESEAESAIGAVERLRPDLVLMDIRLRRGDGVEAAQVISNRFDIPVVFLTAFSDEATLARAMKAGPFGFLVKPFAERELHSTIEVALLKHRAARELNEARQAAEHASLAKTSFLAGMSHEIRNTLNGIVGMTELVLDTPLSGEQRDSLNTVLTSSETLLTLLHDVLDFSRLEARQLRLVERPFSLSALLHRIVQASRAEADRKGLVFGYRVAPEVPDKIVGDATRLTQVLANLVGNALKFTQAGSVTIEVSAIPQDQTLLESLFPDGPPASTTLLFSVRDTGIGIPEEHLQGIFDAFSQGAEETANSYGGTGLGLAICRNLTEMMGGSIWARSTEGVGSSFHFTCRMRPETPAPSPPSSPARYPGTEMHPAPHAARTFKVLVVDDDPTGRTIVCKLLRKRGHMCACADDGMKALQLLTSDRFDMVLLDVKMHPMGGLELLRRIRNAQHPGVDRSIPVVALTAHALRGDRERFLAAGMTDYIAKPVNTSVFNAMLDRMATSIPFRHPPPTIPDRASLLAPDIVLRRHGGDHNLVVPVWLTFCEEAPQRVDLLAKALAEGDAPCAIRHNKRLRLAAEHAGAVAVALMAEQLASRLAEPDLPAARQLLARLETLLARTLAIIRTGLDTPSSAPATGEDGTD